MAHWSWAVAEAGWWWWRGRGVFVRRTACTGQAGGGKEVDTGPTAVSWWWLGQGRGSGWDRVVLLWWLGQGESLSKGKIVCQLVQHTA